MKKNRKFLALVLAALTVFGCIGITAFAADGPIANPTSATVLVNGESIDFDAYNIGGNNYFKLRDVAFVLNGTEKQFELGWDADTKTATITPGQAYTPNNSEMSSKKGTEPKPANSSNTSFILGGEKVTFTAYNIDGSNYIKIRDIGAALDFFLGYDNATRTITVDTSKGYVPEVSPPPTEPPVSTSAEGNTPGNLENNGYFACQGDWIYFRANDRMLYKIRFDGSGLTKLSDHNPRWINVVGEWVYYQHSGDYYNNIYKVKTDGTNGTRIGDARGFNITVSGEWIYYTVFEAAIYKIKTDGTGMTKVCEDKTYGFCYADGWLYYANQDDSNKLYKVKTDGTGRIKVSDSLCSYVNVVGEWIYCTISNMEADGYFHNEDGLFKMKTDGTGKTKLCDGRPQFVNVSGDWAYFQDLDDNYRLAKVKTDGTGLTHLTTIGAEYIHVIGDWVFFIQESHDRPYRIKTDGIEQEMFDY